MKFKIDDAEIKASKIPHEIFLTNLIVNHILFFISALGIVKSIPELVALTPVISIAALSYIMIRGKRIQKHAPWFVRCHWQIAMNRSRLLLMMLTLLTTLLFTLYAVHLYGDVPFAQVFPFAAIVTLPVMVTILALILMESEALHFSSSGQLSKGMVEKFPAPESVVKIED